MSRTSATYSTDVWRIYESVIRNFPNTVAGLEIQDTAGLLYLNLSIDDLLCNRRVVLSSVENNLYQDPLVIKFAEIWAKNIKQALLSLEPIGNLDWSRDSGSLYSIIHKGRLPDHVEGFRSKVRHNAMFEVDSWLCGKEIKEVGGVVVERYYALVHLSFSRNFLPDSHMFGDWFGVKRDFVGSSVVDGEVTGFNLGYCFNRLMSELFNLILSFHQVRMNASAAGGLQAGVFKNFSVLISSAIEAFRAHDFYHASEKAGDQVLEFEPHPVGGCFSVVNQK